LRVGIHPALAVYLVFITLIDGHYSSISFLCTLMIHETGHILTGRAFGEHYSQMNLTPLGGMIVYRSNSTSCKGLRGVLIAASGPVCNVFAILLYLYSPVLRDNIPQEAGRAFILMNASMAFVNLFPVLPLDGGRILFDIGYYLFPMEALTAVLTTAGSLFGVCCAMFALFGLMRWGKLNISLLFSGIYIAIYAGRQREVIYAGNLHTVIQERLSCQRKTACCQPVYVHQGDRIASIIPILCRYEQIICLIESENGIVWIQERSILSMLLKSPYATFAEAFTRKGDRME